MAEGPDSVILESTTLQTRMSPIHPAETIRRYHVLRLFQSPHFELYRHRFVKSGCIPLVDVKAVYTADKEPGIVKRASIKGNIIN